MSNEFPRLSLDEILNGRKRAQKSIPICLRLDVMAEIEELERKIQLAKGTAVDDLRMASGDGDVSEMVDRIRELEEIARQYTIDLRIQALESKDWSAQVASATEEDDEGNKKLDMAAMTEHVLALPGVIVSPEMTASQRTALISGLSDGQWEKVMKDVFDLNRRTVDVGKSLTASLATPAKSAKPGPAAQ